MEIHHAMIVRDQPPDRLFAALTEQDELAVWMDAPTRARPEVGAMLEFQGSADMAGRLQQLEMEQDGTL